MKKLLLAFVVIFITETSLFAWKPEDLTKFPLGQDGKSWILNLGMGFPDFSKYGNGYIYIPPVHLSLDKNVAMGDKKLPFFIGGIVGYSLLGYTGDRYNKEWYHHDISLGARIGYHFNWGVQNLDTYAVATGGWIVYTGNDYSVGVPLWGVNLGARYFVSKGFGFWLETGYNSFGWLDIGLAFKF